jgi:uncharacterized protein
MGLRIFGVNIIGLSEKVHDFHYEFGDEFFKHYGTEVVSQGSLVADVSLDKHETFIEATFKIRGQVKLVCDRSLDPFDHPVKVDKKILFKYGDVAQELSDEIVIIERDTDTLELGQYIYEFIALEIPMKKLHPRYQHEGDMDENAEGKIIYTSGSDQDFDADGGDDIDPRWEKLKKLK